MPNKWSDRQIGNKGSEGKLKQWRNKDAKQNKQESQLSNDYTKFCFIIIAALIVYFQYYFIIT